MATYNGERFIGEQLSSILRQIAPGDEVIVSDDSSTDRTVAIISEFNDSRIRVLEKNTFHNPIFNFENALRHATGEIIVLSDQDDIWFPNKIELIRSQFSARKQPVWLIVTDAEVISENGAVLFDSLFKKFRRVGPGVMANIIDNSYIGCCMAFSRELLTFALPFPKQIPMHDMWLGLVAELFGATSYVPVVTASYRKHENSATNFHISFIPWVQIKRRWHLSISLLKRWLEVRCLNR